MVPNVSSDLTRPELLRQAREHLAHDDSLSEWSDDALANYIIEYAPAEVPLELRLRVRDLDVLDALRALRDRE